eukprot:1034258-Amphidinium_carterae.1
MATVRTLNSLDISDPNVHIALYIVLYVKKVACSKHREVPVPEKLQHGGITKMSMRKAAEVLGVRMEGLTGVLVQAMTLAAKLEEPDAVSLKARQRIISAGLAKDLCGTFTPEAQKQATAQAESDYESAKGLLEQFQKDAEDMAT